MLAEQRMRLERKMESLTEQDLELLIAKYTLEYLHRWTNGFEPTALAQMRELLKAAESPAMLMSKLRAAGGVLPN